MTMTALEMRAALAAGTLSREDAIAHLRARQAACEAAGRPMKYPSLKLLAELTGAGADVRDRKGLSAVVGAKVLPAAKVRVKPDTATAKALAPAKVQPAKPAAKAKAKVAAKPAKPAASVNVGGLDLSSIDPNLIAAFLTAFAPKKR